MGRGSLLLGVAVGLAGAWTGAAAAQEGAVDGLVVTGAREANSTVGTKTDTPLVETPQAISVIPAERFEAQGVQSLQDALLYTSGVRADSYGYDSRGDWAFVRGVDFVQYIDGLRQLYGYYNIARPEPYAMSRIEVLRGPSSVLYGQGTTGGVVNLVSKLPEANFSGEIGVEFGSFENRQIQADFTGPLTQRGDVLGRVVALYRDSESQVDYVPDDRILLAPSLTIRPDAATSITFLLSYQKDETGSSTGFLPHSGTILPNPNGQIPWNRFISEPGFDHYNAETASFGWIASRQFNDALQFRQVARYAHSSLSYHTMYADIFHGGEDSGYLDPNPGPGEDAYLGFDEDGDPRYVARFVDVTDPDTNVFGVDNQLQAEFATGGLAHTLLTGIDYSYYNQTGTAGFSVDPRPFDLFDPVYFGVDMPEQFDALEVTETQTGAYLQDQIALDRWRVVGAVRMDRARSETEGADAITRWATTKRLGVLYAADNGLAPYISYAESFQPQGADGDGAPYLPLRGEQWEVGLKFQPNGAPYIFTAALFQIEESNRLGPEIPGTNRATQLGVVTSEGFELEAVGHIGELWDISLAYSYTDVEEEGAGHQLESVPENLASAWVTRTFPFGGDVEARFGLGARYVGENSGYNDFYTVTVPDQTLFDAMVGLDLHDWSMRLNATNLTDEEYYSTCLGRGDCFLGAKRRVTLNLTRQF
jgi:iron complex outermembrane receptor protein